MLFNDYRSACLLESFRMLVDILDANEESRSVRLTPLLQVHPSSQMFRPSTGSLDHPIVHTRPHRLFVELPVEEIGVESAHSFGVIHGDFKVHNWFAQSDLPSAVAV